MKIFTKQLLQQGILPDSVSASGQDLVPFFPFPGQLHLFVVFRKLLADSFQNAQYQRAGLPMLHGNPGNAPSDPGLLPGSLESGIHRKAGGLPHCLISCFPPGLLHPFIDCFGFRPGLCYAAAQFPGFFKKLFQQSIGGTSAKGRAYIQAAFPQIRPALQGCKFLRAAAPDRYLASGSHIHPASFFHCSQKTGLVIPKGQADRDLTLIESQYLFFFCRLWKISPVHSRLLNLFPVKLPFL